MIIDTHSHPYLEEFTADRDLVMDRAAEAGVGHIILPNVGVDTIAPMKALHQARPATTSMAMGLHPTEVNASWRGALDAISAELRSSLHDYVAVGEVGIDLYWDTTFAAEQREVFAIQCGWAVELGLPVIIHCREGLSLALDVLDSMPVKPQAVFHSFGGTLDDVRRIRQSGDFFFGINGTVTFKNCHVRDTLAEIGLDRILLETDAPYLAPVPKRGRRNEPAFIVHTAAHVAQVLGKTVDEVADTTTLSAKKFFGL